MENGASEETVDQCYEICARFPKNLNWIVRQYDETIRVSAHSTGFGYQFFMIATPEGCEEYDFGVYYHGSRKKQYENCSNN